MIPKTRWQLVDELFSEAVGLDAEARATLLAERCGSDAELRAEVESLLRSADSAPEFLDRPILNAVREFAQEPAPALAAGAHFAQYRIQNRVGAGGMGEVYVAEDERLKRNVALKVLSPHLTADAHALIRFEHEARAASALNHPNILTIFEFGQADGLHYIASEFVEGQTLRQRLGGEIPVTQALDIAAQVAGALAAAHAGGITHRDVKPENIMIRTDGFVKLLDFGIAKLSENAGGPGSPGATLTGRGMVVGTLKYMSPEQARGVKIDPRTDLFSLGAVVYEMIAGKEPFEGETGSDIIAAILKSDPPPLSGSLAIQYPALEAMLRKALQKNCEARYQTAGEFRDDLLRLKGDIEFENRSQQISGSGRAVNASGSSTPAAKQTPGGLVRRAWSSWLVRAALAAMLAAAVWAGFHLFHGAIAGSPPAQTRTLAILPFQNLRPGPDTDFLGFSLADALITKLAYIHSLNVRPSASVDKYRNQPIDPRKAASELQVATLLTGCYLKDGDDLRISAQLIDVKPDKVIWQDSFDVKYDKLLTVQDRVSQEIVSGLALKLSPAEAKALQPGAAIDSRAYEYYLRGVDFYSLNAFQAAISMLEKAAAIDPGYAPMWVELGRAEEAQASLHAGGRDLYEKAENAYERAIALNPSLLEPRVYLGNLFTDTGRVEQAVPLLRAALATSPNDAAAHWELGYAYRFGGMLQESIEEGERARGFDPQIKINSSAMNAYLYTGQYDKFLQSLPANDSVYVLFYRGLGAYYLKRWRDAADAFDRAYAMDPTLLPARIGKALALGLAHRNAEGIAALHKTEDVIQSSGVSDAELLYKLAQAYAVLGDKPAAVRVFQQAIRGGFFCYPYFVRDPLLDNIRRQPGFDSAMQDAQRRYEEFRRRFF